MLVFDEMNFYDILQTSWRGAKDTAQKIYDNDKGTEFEYLIEELYPEGIDRTKLNDLLWFESDWIFEQLGIEEGDKYE